MALSDMQEWRAEQCHELLVDAIRERGQMTRAMLLDMARGAFYGSAVRQAALRLLERDPTIRCREELAFGRLPFKLYESIAVVVPV